MKYICGLETFHGLCIDQYLVTMTIQGQFIPIFFSGTLRKLTRSTYNTSCLVANKGFSYSQHCPSCSAPEVHNVSPFESRQIGIQGVGFKVRVYIHKQTVFLVVYKNIYSIVHASSIHWLKQQLMMCYAYLQVRAGFALGSNYHRHQVWKTYP